MKPAKAGGSNVSKLANSFGTSSTTTTTTTPTSAASKPLSASAKKTAPPATSSSVPKQTNSAFSKQSVPKQSVPKQSVPKQSPPSNSANGIVSKQPAKNLSSSLAGTAGAPPRLGKRISNIRLDRELPILGPPQPLSKTVFTKYDTDKSGFISPDEFGFLVYDMGHALTEAELELAIKRLDSNGDGQISYEEFTIWWKQDERFAKLQLSEDELETLQEAVAVFSQYDVDRKGTIDSEKFKGLYDHLVSLNMTTKTLDSCMRDLDSDGNGEISFNEYVEWTIKTGATKVKLA